MPLKGVLDSVEGLDATIQALYTKRADGKFALDVEGLVDKGKLDEFRNHNIDLDKRLKQAMDQLTQYQGLDPAKAKEALEQLQKLQEKKLIDEGNVEELFAQRTAKMKAEFTEQLAAKDRRVQELEGTVNKTSEEKNQFIVFTELQRALEKPDLGFQPGVADLIKEQVFREFQHRDDKIVRVKPDGSLVYGKNGEPVGLDEFLQGIAKERPYLVKPSSGSGANNNGRNDPNGQKIINRKTFDGFTPQGKMDFVKAGGKIGD